MRDRLRLAPRFRSCVAGQPQAGELPALVGIEEVAIAGPDMAARRGAASAAKNELIAHELAIIFADRPLLGPEARIGKEGASGPFPDVAEHLAETGCCGRRSRPDR